MYARFILDKGHIDNTYAFLCAYIYMYIYASLIYRRIYQLQVNLFTL